MVDYNPDYTRIVHESGDALNPFSIVTSKQPCPSECPFLSEDPDDRHDKACVLTFLAGRLPLERALEVIDNPDTMNTPPQGVGCPSKIHVIKDEGGTTQISIEGYKLPGMPIK